MVEIIHQLCSEMPAWAIITTKTVMLVLVTVGAGFTFNDWTKGGHLKKGS